MNCTVTKRQLIFLPIITFSILIGIISIQLYQQSARLNYFSSKSEQSQVAPTATQTPPKPEELIRDKQIEYFVTEVQPASPSSELTNKTIIKADPVSTKTGTDWVIEAIEVVNPTTSKCLLNENCDHKSYYYSSGKAIDISVLSNTTGGGLNCHVLAIDDIKSWRATWTATPPTQAPLLFIQQTCNQNYPFYNVYQLIDFQQGKLIPFRDTTGAIPKNMIDAHGQVWGNTFVDQLIYGPGPFLLISAEKVASEKSQKHNSYSIFRLNLGKHTIDKHIVL
jgi:hypothetical protein